MEKKKAFFQSWRIVGLTFGLVCVAMLSFSMWLPHTKSDSQKNTLPQVKNETESFQLVSAEKQGDILLLKMKNVSGKGITAYSISSRPTGREDTDYSISGHVIEPGDIEEVEVPFSAFYTINSSTQQKPVIHILAVVFDDHTSEGDFGVATVIKDTRSGKKTQLKRINRLLREALQSPDDNLNDALNQLKSRIALLSEEPEMGQSLAIQSGLHNAKEDVLRLIERFEQSQTAQDKSPLAENGNRHALREGLNKLVQEGEKWVARY